MKQTSIIIYYSVELDLQNNTRLCKAIQYIF